MTYDFGEFNTKKEHIIEWLKKEFSSIRTGRATVTLLDGVMVDSYGVRTPLNQVANLSVEDPRTIKISPWDKKIINEIEKSITKMDLGISTSANNDGIRVIFPELTTENREKLVKLAKSKTEEAKVSLRNDRAVTIRNIDSEKEGNLSEDDAKRYKDELQKKVEETQKSLDDLMKKKEEEIMS